MASFTSNVPISAILKSKDAAPADEAPRQTKEEYRKMKELEEMRKEGTAPAVVDETGRDINPHIPQFISQAPWYFGAEGATLKHQRPHKEAKPTLSELTDNYQRGVKASIATKYRKGACENCGAMTHKKKDCFERPRKIGARFTGDEIAPDEFLPPSDAGEGRTFDAKRDRWHNYDPTEHAAVIDEYNRLEETRKMVKAEQIKEAAESAEAAALAETEAAEGEEEGEGGEKEKPQQVPPTPTIRDDDRQVAGDEDKYAEDADMPGVKTDMDSRTRITVRNLRIREDTAKYLYNLDPESAYYDPKSRSMRQNPFEGTSKEDEKQLFSGENFVRFSGEVMEVNKAQLFAWDAHRKGVDVHALAEPTKLESLRNELDSRKGIFKSEQKKAILEKYGGEEHLDAPPKELLLAQSERYVEFNRKGKVIKGEEKTVLTSRYEEDVLINNHTHVWGSYWRDGLWGYRCCHSHVKNSYCTGEAGKAAAAVTKGPSMNEEKKSGEASPKKDSSSSSSSSSSDEDDAGEKAGEAADSSGSGEPSTTAVDARQAAAATAERRREQKRKRRQKQKASAAKRRKLVDSNKHSSSSSSSSSSSDSSSDEEGGEEAKKKKQQKKKDDLREALIEAARRDREAAKSAAMDDRQRPYNKHYEAKAPTEHEMEAYRLRQLHADDPMAKFLTKK